MNVHLGLAALLLLGSYLCGAVPTSYLVAKWFRGIDLREHGSKNLGATNLYRTLGWKFAVPVGLIDVAKGAIPVLLLGPRLPGVALFPTLCGVMAVIGHVYSVFVGFKEGRGRHGGRHAARAGTRGTRRGFDRLARAGAFHGVCLAGIGCSRCRFPSRGLPAQSRPANPHALALDVAVALFVIWKHRGNIHRLLNGTESRFGRRGDAAPSRR